MSGSVPGLQPWFASSPGRCRQGANFGGGHGMGARGHVVYVCSIIFTQLHAARMNHGVSPLLHAYICPVLLLPTSPKEITRRNNKIKNQTEESGGADRGEKHIMETKGRKDK